jgi:hypothetical protein
MGSEIASVVRLSLGILPVVRLLVNPQIRDLSTGEFVQTLIREVVKRIYNPTIAPEEAASKRHIPITACVGTRDRAVTGTSALAIFERNPPIYLDADHGSIKEPSSRRDRRYLALKNILVAHYSTWFRETAEQCLDGSAPKSAAGSLFMRCEHALEARLLARPDLAYAAKPAGKQRALKIRLLRLAVELTREMPTQPLGTILNAALVGL